MGFPASSYFFIKVFESVSIPDRVLWVFRPLLWRTRWRALCVSIPDRVLWVFRLLLRSIRLKAITVSIPDRVLWVFRQRP